MNIMGSLSPGLDTNAVWFGKKFFHSPLSNNESQTVQLLAISSNQLLFRHWKIPSNNNLQCRPPYRSHRTRHEISLLPPRQPNRLKVHLDVTRQETITKAIADAVDNFPGIDVFINNAWYSLMGDMEGIAEADA